MTKTLTRTIAILALIALSACATVHGIGTDIGNAGDAIASTTN